MLTLTFLSVTHTTDVFVCLHLLGALPTVIDGIVQIYWNVVNNDQNSFQLNYVVSNWCNVNSMYSGYSAALCNNVLYLLKRKI